MKKTATFADARKPVTRKRTPGKTVTMTREDARKWSQSKEGRESAKRIASVPDKDIDTSDIPEVKDFSKFIRLSDHPEHPLYRAVTRPVTIRAKCPRPSSNPCHFCEKRGSPTRPTSKCSCIEKRSNGSWQHTDTVRKRLLHLSGWE